MKNNQETVADGSNSKHLIDLIKSEFADSSRPASTAELARLYGVMAAQHDAMLACFAIAVKANPRLIFTDEVQAGQKAIGNAIQALGDALTDLASSLMSDKDREEYLAESESND